MQERATCIKELLQQICDDDLRNYKIKRINMSLWATALRWCWIFSPRLHEQSLWLAWHVTELTFHADCARFLKYIHYTVYLKAFLCAF